MRTLLAIAALFALTACATSGTLYNDAKHEYKPVPKGQSRLYVYRENSPIGWAVQPSVVLDGVKIRDSVPGSFTMRDIRPGAHALTNEGEVEKRLDFKVEPQETYYVREEIGAGWAWGRIHMIGVDATIAQEELGTLHEQTFTSEAK